MNNILQNKTVDKILYESDKNDRDEVIITFTDGTWLKIGCKYLVYDGVKEEQPYIWIT